MHHESYAAQRIPCLDDRKTASSNDGKLIPMATVRKYRITWLHNEPSPNQMEFFQELAKSPEVRLRVLTCSAGFARRPFSLGKPWMEGNGYAFTHKVLKGFNFPLGKHREFYINPEIIREVFNSSRDELWIVGGYAIPTVQMAMWALKMRNLKWILVNEAPLVESRFRDLVRNMLLLPVQIGARGVLVYGSGRRAQFYRRFMPEGKVINTAQFQNLSPLMAIAKDPNAFAPGHQRPLRFFYAGRLEKFSGVDLLIRAFNRLAQERGDVELEILGEGSERPQLQELVQSDLRSKVTFHGAVPREDVPGIFAHGDVFVHPNHKQGWGMVVNEALAAGMPVIASRTVGAAEELLIDGVNGFLLESPNDEDGFFQRMKFFAENRDSLARFVNNSRDTASQISLDKGAREFVAVIEKLFSGL
jgi:glycosyltransferase involved in cell wall biosynthesis